MSTLTSRLSLVEWVGADVVSTIRTGNTTNMGTLDNTVLVTEGTFASRPAASSVEKDHVYKATDTGLWYIGDGTNWNTMIVAGAWANLSLGSGITAFGGGTFTPAYRLEADTLRLRGQATNAAGSKASGFTWATLPAGFRPTSAVDVAVMVANNPIQMCDLTVNTNGTMTVGVSASGTVAISSILLLDGLTFSLS